MLGLPQHVAQVERRLPTGYCQALDRGLNTQAASPCLAVELVVRIVQDHDMSVKAL